MDKFFIACRPTSGLTNFSKNYLEILNFYQCNDAFFYYMGQRVYVKTLGFAWFDAPENWQSINTRILVFYLIKESCKAGDFQLSYKPAQYPDRYFYYLPFNFWTNDIIYTSNSGFSKAAQGQRVQVYANNRTLVSLLNTSVPEEAYSQPTVAQINVQTSPGVWTPVAPKFAPNGTALTTIAPPYQIQNDNFDQIICYPLNKNSFDSFTCYNTANTFYLNSKTIATYTPIAEYWLMQNIRTYNKQQPSYGASQIMLDYTPTTKAIDCLFVAKRPICGNTVCGAVFDNPNTFPNTLNVYKTIKKSDLKRGIVNYTAGTVQESLEGNQYYYVFEVEGYTNTEYLDFDLRVGYPFPNANAPNRIMQIVRTVNNGRQVRSSTYNRLPTLALNLRVNGLCYLIWDPGFIGYSFNWETATIPVNAVSPYMLQQYARINTSQYKFSTCLPSNLYYNAATGFLQDNYNELGSEYEHTGLYTITKLTNLNLSLTPLYNYNTFSDANLAQFLYSYNTPRPDQASFGIYTENNTDNYGTSLFTVVDQTNFKTGVWMFEDAFCKKSYYGFRHLVEFTILVEMDLDNGYVLDGDLFKYNWSFSLPDEMPDFKYAAVYALPWKIVDDDNGYFPDYTTKFCLTSDMFKTSRNKVPFSFVQNDTSAQIQFCEIAKHDNIHIWSDINFDFPTVPYREIVFCFLFRN